MIYDWKIVKHTLLNSIIITMVYLVDTFHLQSCHVCQSVRLLLSRSLLKAVLVYQCKLSMRGLDAVQWVTLRRPLSSQQKGHIKRMHH